MYKKVSFDFYNLTVLFLLSLYDNVVYM